MAWVRATCGRIKSDYRYSNEIVYNNFPWPINATQKQIKEIELAAAEILKIRADYPDSSLSDLYDPIAMPTSLSKAHNKLDRLVDLVYRPQVFTNEANRLAFLFDLYDQYTKDLFSIAKPQKTKSKS